MCVGVCVSVSVCVGVLVGVFPQGGHNYYGDQSNFDGLPLF